MKAGEIKMKLANGLMDFVDMYFNEKNLSEKFINSTLKIIIKQNINKIDPLLLLFTDENGDINVDEIMKEYAQMIDDDGFIFDLKEYVHNDMVKNFIPDKALVIRKEDILSILK
jgi:L-2-hydroxyglutarate oxidase LhgO